MTDEPSPDHAALVVERLSPDHLADLRSSGLTDETIALAQLRTVTDGDKLKRYLNWKPGGRWKLGDAITFPHRSYVTGAVPAVTVKPDKPRKSKGKPLKYESPKDVKPTPPYLGPRCLRGRWLDDSSRPILWTEGQKKTLYLDQLGYAAIGLAGVDNFHDKAARDRGEGLKWGASFVELVPYLEGRDCVIVYDADALTNPGVRNAERRLAGLLLASGAASVRIARIPRDDDTPKAGIDDYGVKHGDEAARRVIDSAEPVTDAIDPRRVAPSIVIDHELHRVTDEACAALGRHPHAYHRAGQLVRVVPGEDGGAPAIRTLTEAAARDCLSLVADWRKVSGEELVPARPDTDAVRAVLARGQWPQVRHLSGVVDHPVILADGEILQAPGYHAVSGLYLAASVELGRVPTQPSQDDARRAARELLEVIQDFPAAALAHRAAWVGLVLTMLSRYAYPDAPAPMTVVDGTTRGVGKGLMADAASVIVRGHELARTPWQDRDDAETSKQITAAALAGTSSVLLDNVEGVLGGPSLNAALTSTQWAGRRLGHSEMTPLPLRATWIATGNNVALDGDTTRRVMHVRLESPLENPEDRRDVAHPDLLGWVRSERPRLLAAALTMLRAHAVAGWPVDELTPWGSYAAWSRVVRGACVYAGLADPGETRLELREQGDAVAGALGAWLQAFDRLLTVTRRDAMRAAEIVEVLGRPDTSGPVAEAREALDALVPGRPGMMPGARTIGYRLRSYRGRVVGGRRLESSPTNIGAEWYVVRSLGVAGGEPARGDGGDRGDVPAISSRKISNSLRECPKATAAASPPSPPSPQTAPGDFADDFADGPGWVEPGEEF